MPGDKLKIMVSSTVYGSESDLDQIKATLESFEYDVVMSKDGDIYVPMDDKNEDACIKAVDDCDLFFGIIFPRYGSGITHKEFLRAINQDKPMWFACHYTVEYTRKLMKQFMFDANGKRVGFDIQPTSVLDSLKVVDMYNDVRHKWVQPFMKTPEILHFVNNQFKDMQRRKEELQNRSL